MTAEINLHDPRVREVLDRFEQTHPGVKLRVVDIPDELEPEPVFWAVIEVDPDTGRPTAPDPHSGWLDDLAEAKWHAQELNEYRVFEVREVKP